MVIFGEKEISKSGLTCSYLIVRSNFENLHLIKACKMKIKIFTLLIILFTSRSFSQTDSIQNDIADVLNLMFKIDRASVKIPTKEFKIVFNDAITNITLRNSVIEAESTLSDGTELFDIKYYLENNHLIIIETQEKSKKLKNENYTLSETFQVKDENSTESISGHTVSIC
jgi:hypothetical protein